MNKYYFFAKVDNGNRLLSKAEEWGGFYIGFQDTEIVSFTSSKSHEIKLNYPDLEFLSLFSSNMFRNSVVVVTFSQEEIIFWNITGELKYLRDVKSVEERKKIKKYCEDLKIEESETDFDKWKFLPTKKICSMKRDFLFPPINSLAVYQYLNQGTFRPFFRLAEAKNKLIPLEIMDEQFYPNVEPIEILSKRKNGNTEEKLVETYYGKFIRIYFDSILEANGSYDFVVGLKKKFKPLSTENKISLVFSIFNPAQFETLASLLLLDFGFTLDIGKGNSLDVIDVRGTVIHRNADEQEEILTKFLQYFDKNKIMEFSDKFIAHVQETKSISIQCKAEDTLISEDNFLVFQPTNVNNSKNVLPLEKMFKLIVSDKNNFPYSNDWITMIMNRIF